MKLSNWMDLLPAEEMARLIRQEEEPPLDAIWDKAQRRAERVKKAEKQHAKRWKRGLLIAAAVCVAAAGTALAAAIFRWNQPLVEQYNPPETIREELIQTGKDLNYRVEHDGVAVTFQQVIGDENEIKVLCQVESVDGRGWQGGVRTIEYFLDGVSPDYRVCQMGGWQTVGDTSQGDKQRGAAVQDFALFINPVTSIDGRVITVRVKDFFREEPYSLQQAGIDWQTASPDIAETWQASFRVDYSLLTKTDTYYPNKPVKVGDTWTLHQISISPLSAKVVLLPPSENAIFDPANEGIDFDDENFTAGEASEIVYYMDDGSVRVLNTSGSSAGIGGDDAVFLGRPYWAIDTSQIRAIAVGPMTKINGITFYEPRENPEDYPIHYFLK